jgi:hypothetical protein
LSGRPFSGGTLFAFSRFISASEASAHFFPIEKWEIKLGKCANRRLPFGLALRDAHCNTTHPYASNVGATAKLACR